MGKWAKKAQRRIEQEEEARSEDSSFKGIYVKINGQTYMGMMGDFVREKNIERLRQILPDGWENIRMIKKEKLPANLRRLEELDKIDPRRGYIEIPTDEPERMFFLYRYDSDSDKYCPLKPGQAIFVLIGELKYDVPRRPRLPERSLASRLPERTKQMIFYN